MSNEFRRKENESVKDFKVRICSNKENYNMNWDDVRIVLNAELGEKHGESKYRKEWYAFKDGMEYQKDILTNANDTVVGSKIKLNDVAVSDATIDDTVHITTGTLDAANINIENTSDKNEVIPPYKETTEILKDGLQRSDKLVKMNEQQRKDPDFLLEAHGYEPSEWELTNSKSSMWNQHNKQHGTVILYSSKITVKPKEDGVDWNGLIESIQKFSPTVPKIDFKGAIPSAYKTLNIPLFDMHFGINTYEDYEPTLEKILSILDKNTYVNVIIPIGQDLLHTNDFRGQTASGTLIGKIEFEKAWEDAHNFYRQVIDKALEKSVSVKVVYSKGNHDESSSWAFVKMIESEYLKGDNAKSISFDTRFKERKAYLLGNVFIGITHGDKARKNTAAIFSTEFPQYWAQANTREVYLGHLHRKRSTKKETELINDADGLIVRELGTGNKIDQYHEDYGYTMAHREFEIFEYDKDNKTHIYYV